jgi:hypothetical protein
MNEFIAQLAAQYEDASERGHQARACRQTKTDEITSLMLAGCCSADSTP